MKDPQFWIQIGVTLIAALAYFILYKQQQPLLKRYKEGFEHIDRELATYKNLFSMESMEIAVKHNIAIKTPEIEKQLIDRMSSEGKEIIQNNALIELLEQTHRVATWLFSVDKEFKGNLEAYINQQYPNSKGTIMWYIGEFHPESLSIQKLV